MTPSGGEEALLCFGLDEMEGCYKFDGLVSSKAPSSTHSHYMTSMGNYQNTAIVLGCWWDENKAVEQYKDGQGAYISRIFLFYFLQSCISGLGGQL